MKDKILMEEKKIFLIKYLECIANSFDNTCDVGLKETAKRYYEFIEHLKNKDIKCLSQYADNIFNKINWNTDDYEQAIINKDYMMILVYILNIFRSLEEETNFAQFNQTKEIFNNILKVIQTKINQVSKIKDK